jgi:hypothetical protein
MNQPIAIVLAGALIAGAILITNHWALGVAAELPVLMNRWTGNIVWCIPDVVTGTVRCQPRHGDGALPAAISKI